MIDGKQDKLQRQATEGPNRHVDMAGLGKNKANKHGAKTS